MRRAGKIDANQPEIVAALRDAGCSVLSLAQLGGGVPDLLIGRGNLMLLVINLLQAWTRRRGNRNDTIERAPETLTANAAGA